MCLIRGQKPLWVKVEGGNEEGLLVGTEDAVVIVVGWFILCKGGWEGGE